MYSFFARFAIPKNKTNMKKELENFAEAERMIKQFCSEFYEKFGFWPMIKFNMKSLLTPKLKLEDLKDIVNAVFKESFPDIYTDEGIMLKTRKHLTLMHRHIFYKIAREVGYTYKDIAVYSGFDHATIIYAVRRISDLLDVKDQQLTESYNLVKNEIQIRHSNARDVQHDEQREPDAKSILLSILQEGEHKSSEHQHPSGDESVGGDGIHRQESDPAA